MTISGSSGLIFPDGSGQETGIGRNRIINGDMRIDQRNAGASTTPTGAGSGIYTLDRWCYQAAQTGKVTVQQNAGAVTPPVGFKNYAGITSASSYSVLTGDYFHLYQAIEGFNVADLDWGTANAKTITISFWVRSSLTGTFGGSLRNEAVTRSYPFTYTISSANTWEQKSITIAGDTSGTWLTNNGVGIYVGFGLGSGATFSGTAGAWSAGNFVQPTSTVSVVGTNGATFYITGVQLEQNTSATPFERRLYGQELANCQRYFEKSYSQGTAVGTANSPPNRELAVALNTLDFYSAMLICKVTKRTDATFLTYSTVTGTSGKVRNETAGADANSAIQSPGDSNCFINGSLTAGNVYSFQWTATAEL